MSQNTKFITNEEGFTLADKFRTIIKKSESFDALVGYFYSSGFHAIYPSLENTEKIRILIGISTNKDTYDLISEGNQLDIDQITSYAETKEEVGAKVQAEMESSEDSESVEEGVNKFIDWIRSGKLTIRAYDSQNIHAKLYVMTMEPGMTEFQKGIVITGSSNFTKSGLIDNLEFNVELKDPADYNFAKDKFDELWDKSIDVSEQYVETIQKKTWLSNKITPYELYLKFLYEHFIKELSLSDEIILPQVPENFLELQYQKEAVTNAKKILLKYGGVFVSDVVGLGKTYTAAMLAKQLDGRHLVIAPPNLLDEEDRGSWPNAFIDFGVNAPKFVSIGKLDTLLDGKSDKFQNVFIDEAHRMRNADTATYEKLAEICRGKRVILVSATPYNNSPEDILSLISLFQKPRNSNIPGLSNLRLFFNNLERKIKKENRKTDPQSFKKVTQLCSKEIRNKVLRHLMVRRTRSDIEMHYSEDLESQDLRFPLVHDPVPFYYQLSEQESEIFDETIQLLANEMHYARYKPMTYYTGDDFNESALQGQKNLAIFMKILLVKRLDSSFFAFKQSIDRFLESYTRYIKAFENGSVYISKEKSNKILEYFNNDNFAAIDQLLLHEDNKEYKSKDFEDSFISHLKDDKKVIKKIKDLWREVDRDPKIETLIDELSTRDELIDSHLIIFTESKETARYLFQAIDDVYNGEVICYDGESSVADKRSVMRNFDASSSDKEERYRILIATEVLAEGVNLHRSNIVINYDIPWNPTKIMQRVGRVNRLDTTFDEIHTFNYFPSIEVDDQIALKSAAESKIAGFHELLGDDAKILTDNEEIVSHSLFNTLNTLQDEEEPDSELKYLKIIKDIRKNNPNLFERIKTLPKKARSSKKVGSDSNALVSFFRKGDIEKFFIARKDQHAAEESDPIAVASLLECLPGMKRETIPGDIYELLDNNKSAFRETLNANENTLGGNKGNVKTLFGILKVIKKQSQQFTEEQEDYLERVMTILKEEMLPKKTLSSIMKSLENLGQDTSEPLKVINILKSSIPDGLLKSHYVENQIVSNAKSEVILSMYLKS